MGEVKKMDSEKAANANTLKCGIDGKVDVEHTKNALLRERSTTPQRPVQTLVHFNEPLKERTAPVEPITHEPSAPTVEDRRPKPHLGRLLSTSGAENYKPHARELTAHKYGHSEPSRHGVHPQGIRISASTAKAHRAELALWQLPEIKTLTTDMGETTLLQGVRFELPEASMGTPKDAVLQKKTPNLKIFTSRRPTPTTLLGRLLPRLFG